MGAIRKIRKRTRMWHIPLIMHNGQHHEHTVFSESEARYNLRQNKLNGLSWRNPSADGYVAHALLKHGRDRCKTCTPRVNPKPRRGKGFPR